MTDLVLITGASGFTGTHVVHEFLANGKRVRAMVRSEEKGRPLKEAGAEIVVADLAYPQSLKSAVEGVTGVVHIAALFRQAGLPESEFIKVNVEGTRALLDYSVKFGIRRFVHCSTVGVHGNVENPPADEDSPFNPGDMYQRSKLEAEMLVRSYLESGTLSGIVIRPGMIYGPHDTRTRKLFSMISKRRFFYVGKGDRSVHFIDVRDLARAFLQAFEKRELTAKTYIIAGEEAMPLYELVSRIALILNVPEPAIHIPVRPIQAIGSLCEAICTPLGINPPIYRRRVDFFTKTRSFCTRRAQRDLGFCPKKGSFDELVDIINSYVEDCVIQAPKLSRPCLIRRSKDGIISFWDGEAERFYGWRAKDVLGKVSHELFNTEFPAPLESIDRKIAHRGQWIGNLSHRTCAGGSVSVLSKWSVRGNQEDEDKAIEEENRIRIFPPGQDNLGYFPKKVANYAFVMCDLLNDFLQIGINEVRFFPFI